MDGVSFEKAPGQFVTLSRRSADTLVAVQPGKPEAMFVLQAQEMTS